METYHVNNVCEYEVSSVYNLRQEILGKQKFWENGDFGPNRGNWPFFVFGPKQLFKSFSTKRKRKQFVK